MNADSSALQDLDKDVEGARQPVIEAMRGDHGEWIDAESRPLLDAFESSIVRREAGEVMAARAELESSQERGRRPRYGDVTADGFMYGCWDCEDGKPHEPHSLRQTREEALLAELESSREKVRALSEAANKVDEALTPWFHDERIDSRALVSAMADLIRAASSDDSRPPRPTHVITWYCLGCERAGVTLNNGGGHTIEGSVPDNCGPVVPLLNAEDVLDEAALRMLDESLAEYRDSLPRPSLSIPEINKEDER